MQRRPPDHPLAAEAAMLRLRSQELATQSRYLKQQNRALRDRMASIRAQLAQHQPTGQARSAAPAGVRE